MKSQFPAFRLLVVALATAVALIACSGDGSVPDDMTNACPDGVLSYASALKPALPVDFAGTRVERADFVADGRYTFRITRTQDTFGTPCATAKDKPLCERNLDAIRVLGATCNGGAVTPAAAPAEPTPSPCVATYLVYTRGDEVGAIVTAEQARAFFGPIDTPQEAMYLASLGGETFSCSSPARPGYKTTPEGYELLAADDCVRRFLRVTREGVVTFLRTDHGC